MLKITDLKSGVLIELEGRPYLVLNPFHKILGRGQGMTRTKLKDLESGTTIERVFKGEGTIKEASLAKTKASYLYQKGGNFWFMDNQTFEQLTLFKSALGFSSNFLKEGQIVEILSFKNKPINISLPIKIELSIAETGPGVKGGRETAGTKRAVLETGYALTVPLFIKEGDKILVDTRDGRYIERAK